MYVNNIYKESKHVTQIELLSFSYCIVIWIDVLVRMVHQLNKWAVKLLLFLALVALVLLRRQYELKFIQTCPVILSHF